METQTNFPGYIQAGGGSTRFGTDKSLVQLGGKTIMQRTSELVAAVCGSVRIVAPSGRYSDAPALMIADRWPGEGPLGGILTALYHADELSRTLMGAGAVGQEARAFVLIVSCDMPFLTRDWLLFLRERAGLSKAEIIVPKSTNGLEPLCACWRMDIAAPIQRAFDSGVRKVTEAMKRLRMEVLDEAAWKRFDTDGRLFWNMNTIADYEEARRVFEERAGRARPLQG